MHQIFKSLPTNIAGQATTELAISLLAFLILMLGMDLTCAFTTARLKMTSLAHFYLFRAYRHNEGLEPQAAPHPDMRHIEIVDHHDDISDKGRFDFSLGELELGFLLKPELSDLNKRYLNLELQTSRIRNKILVDPWHEHPLKYASWAVAAGIVAAKTFSGSYGDTYSQMAEGGMDAGSIMEAGSFLSEYLENMDWPELNTQTASPTLDIEGDHE